MIQYFQKGFNYGQDGPGNRLVYHLMGCNMRCPWCSNPEGMAAGRGAYKTEPVSHIAGAVLSARPMFFDGGGLTLTGGEATLQFEPVMALFEKVRAFGVHTALETNATHPRFLQLVPLVDYLIADFKHPDDAAHRAFTGLSNRPIKANLERAAAMGGDILMRVPLIHGVNDDQASFEGFRQFFAQFAGREGVRVEVLRYHEYGADKWAKCGEPYQMKDAFLPDGRAEALERALTADGIAVIRT
jgi:pyruvate formate lyase activating enzyme